MFSTVELIIISWCVSILINEAFRVAHKDYGSEWDGFMWIMFIASIVFAPFVAVCNLLDDFPYIELNKIFTTSMFQKENTCK